MKYLKEQLFPTDVYIVDDVLEEESTERDKRYITNMIERTSSYSEPTDDFIDNY